MKKVLFIMLFLLPLFSFQYLEYKYRCKLSTNYVTISLGKKKGYIKCLKILDKINKKISVIKNNQEQAYKNYLLSYSNYWKKIYDQQSEKLKLFNSFKINLINQLNTFEKKFFIKVKKFLDKYFRGKLKEVAFKKKNLAFQRQKILLQGKEKELKDINNKLQYYQVLEFLINNIISCKNFSQLVPLLKLYVQLDKGR